MSSPMLQMAIDLLVHGLQHFVGSHPLDFRLAIIHADQSIELSLKERVRIGGRPVMKPGGKESISIHEAYRLLDDLAVPIPEKPNLELLHEERNRVQHLMSTPDYSLTRFHIDNATSFLERFFAEEFGARLLSAVPISLLSHPRLQFLPDVEKIRLLIDGAGKAFKTSGPEGIASLMAALGVGLQLLAARSEKTITGNSIEELVADARQHHILPPAAFETANKVLTCSDDADRGTLPPVEVFTSLVASLRQAFLQQ